MQFLILFTGAMVFVFYSFVQPPLLFDRVQLERIGANPAYTAVEQRYQTAFEKRRAAAYDVAQQDTPQAVQRVKEAHSELEAARKDGARLTGISGFNDANYVFLTFVTRYLPAGVVGLILAVIFAAA